MRTSLRLLQELFAEKLERACGKLVSALSEVKSDVWSELARYDSRIRQVELKQDRAAESEKRVADLERRLAVPPPPPDAIITARKALALAEIADRRSLTALRVASGEDLTGEDDMRGLAMENSPAGPSGPVGI